MELEPVDAPLADDDALGTGELLRSDAQEVVWRTPLRLAHLIGGWFPLHPLTVQRIRLTPTRAADRSSTRRPR
ncbi:hypothetical protein [Streptomyces sp. NPDC002491]